MDSKSIRRRFLDFFASRGHQIVPSAPLVVKNDPTLMFTNAGMNQFKDYFLGHSVPANRRIADTQKCLRVSGKHNDLEEVGIDTYHHTLFEMLGNWSFGDYFKKEAIDWAWELLTREYKLPAERMYATVFGGDKSENLPVDQEALALWKKILPAERVILGSKKDNFWEMGDTGPCGPCSELHIDLRPEAEVKKLPGLKLVNTGHPQVIEIWNLVFIQFNRTSSGELQPLPDKHVDTGMGFERLAMAIQGKTSTYDTDIFTPLLDFISREARTRYGKDEKKDIAMRVLADHIRAVSFAIADGQLPSNTGAGYVIRRILRRAVRYGFTFLGFHEPFLHRLVPVLAAQFEDVFPEVGHQSGYVARVIQEEESSFLRTLEKGLKRFEAVQAESKSKVIAGSNAFELYDTYGFPFDLTSLIARERGYTVDEAGFRKEMEGQKERSRADAVKETGDWITLVPADRSEFVGYDANESVSKVVKYRKVKQKGKESYQVVLDRTPFYAESGGQVGDTGTLTFGAEMLRVTDTKKENDLILHLVDRLPKDTSGNVGAAIDVDRRNRIVRNHSATHLLHAGLRSVIGKHVEQRGSLVNEKLLRFDFSHFAPLSTDELARVEHMVNARILENIPRGENRSVPLEKAKQMGAMALFGEKYGDTVRVVTFDPAYSIELCGGTHVPATGHIGLFKITSEGSVAAGVRRIEAVTGEGALEFMKSELTALAQVRELLNNPRSVVESTQALLTQVTALEKKLDSVFHQQAVALKRELASKAKRSANMSFIAAQIALPNADALRQIAYDLRAQFDDLFLVLAADVDGKPQIAVMLGDKIVEGGKFHAGELVKSLAREIDGGGGGQPFFATAGGKNLAGLPKVVDKAEALVA
jgi:alanyl-tRNA synthetase